MELFDKFDRVNYNGYELTNILRKIVPIRRMLSKIDVYYNYTIKEGERADTIAHDYYGSSTFTWLIYVVNDIIDPYYQWPLSNTQMYDYLERKYGDFYQIQIDIKHYKNDSEDYYVSPYTFSQMTQEQRFGWYPQTIYDWEIEQNEKKREIKLISNTYLEQIKQELNAIFE